MPHFFIPSDDATKVFDGSLYPSPPNVVMRVISTATVYYSNRRDDLIPDTPSGAPRNGTPFASTDNITTLYLNNYSEELWVRGTVSPSTEISIVVQATEAAKKRIFPQLSRLFGQSPYDGVGGNLRDGFGSKYGRSNWFA